MKGTVNLSSKQREIVNFEKGPVLVTASAGSGKTRVLTERIKLLIEKTKKRILAITFTNKAAEEIAERLEPVSDLRNRVFIGTFHSFCQQIIEQRFNLIGMKEMPHIFENQNDRLLLIEKAIELTPLLHQDFMQKSAPEQKKYLFNILNYVSNAKRNILNDFEYTVSETDESIYVYNSYISILNSQNAIDFDDILLLAYRILVENPDVASLYNRSYEYILVDEAQDLNFIQYQLLKLLSDKKINNNLMLVGDPNQSIFAFNGSSSEYMYKHFKSDYQPIEFWLEENFRSSRQVLSTANKLLNIKTSIVNEAIEGKFELESLQNEEQEATWVVQKIIELIAMDKHDDIEGSIEYTSIAVLARNKFIFKDLTDQLNKENIPYEFKIPIGGVKFESKYMQGFDLAFKVKLNNRDSLHWNMLIKHLNNKKVESIDQLPHIYKEDEVYGKLFATLVALDEQGSNLIQLVKALTMQFNNLSNILESDDLRLLLWDLDELRRHWMAYAKRTDTPSLLQFKNSMALGQTDISNDLNGVTLSTVHTMKGLEYDIVFIIGMDEGTFPDYRAVSAGGVELRQELNNAYVAFTRAKRFLYVTYPRTRIMPWGDIKRRELSRFLRGLGSK